MQEILNWLDFGNNTWIAHVFIAVLATVVFNFFLKIILGKMHLKAEASDNVWDDALIFALRKPLLLFVWVIGLSITAEIVEVVSQNEVFQHSGLLRKICIILLIMLFLIRLIKNVEANILLHNQCKTEKEKTDQVTVRVVGRLLRLAVLITTGLVILQTLEISVSGVVAFGGIGGIAIGFAAKDLLANFFGGLMIYLDRPFTEGDWVRSPDREIEGTVENIGWRLTRIRTFDKRPLYVPNAAFTTIAVENPSRMLNRRIKEVFGLRYADSAKMREIIAAVRAMLQEHDEIDHNATLIVNFNTLAPSSMDFFIYTFTKTTDWIYFHEVKQDILLKIVDIIHQHEADLAFPTLSLDGIDDIVQSR